MLLSLLVFLAALVGAALVRQCGLWGALLAHYAARADSRPLRYPVLVEEVVCA